MVEDRGKPMNLLDVTRELATEEQCFSFLEAQRWPNGVRCPVCGADKISRITRETPSKNKRAQLYQCLEPTCKQQFSVTSGTIFHGSRVPLSQWFMAISLVMDAKKGMSAKQLQQHLGLGSYQTAWHMTHRIRKAMDEPANPFNQLRGIVELDETYVGGKSKDRYGRARNRKPRAEKFDMVLGLRERGQHGRVKLIHIPDGKKETIRAAVQEHVVPSPTRIYTDDASVYDFAFDRELRKKHRSVNHSIEWVVPGTRIHTNTIESAFSLFKRSVTGSFHRVSLKHLHRYLSEFSCRFNARHDAQRFEKMISRTAQASRLTYRELVSDGDPDPTPF
jgi:transposase-like protein/nicotinamide mononucleotide adenylyltransferase